MIEVIVVGTYEKWDSWCKNRMEEEPCVYLKRLEKLTTSTVNFRFFNIKTDLSDLSGHTYHHALILEGIYTGDTVNFILTKCRRT